MHKKDKLLGMPFGTASNRLRKSIMFKLLKKLKENVCFRCGQAIDNIAELSIDHKSDWLNSREPIEKFFDLDNIAFSHLKCNRDSKGPSTVPLKHPSHVAYSRGCRCEECKNIEKHNRRRQRASQTT